MHLMVNHELPESANPPSEPEVTDYAVAARLESLENGGVSTFLARIAIGLDEPPFSGGENPPRMSRPKRKPHSGVAHAIGTDRDVYQLQSLAEPKPAGGIPMPEIVRTQRLSDLGTRESEKIMIAEQRDDTSEAIRLRALGAKRGSNPSNTFWARTHR